MWYLSTVACVCNISGMKKRMPAALPVTDEGPFPEAYKTQIAARLRLTRRAKDLGQYEFAERAGLAGNTYNQYEQANVEPFSVANLYYG